MNGPITWRISSLTWDDWRRKTAPESVALTADLNPGPNRPHLSERGSAVGIMLPSDEQGNNRGWRADDLTPDDIAPLLNNFITKFEPGAPDECWLWRGTRMNNGYGGLGRSYRGALLAHRVSWVAFTGQSLTNQQTIDHLCSTKLCVNPDHLEPVSLVENIERARRRRGYLSATERAELVPCDACGKSVRRGYLRKHSARVHAEAA